MSGIQYDTSSTSGGGRRPFWQTVRTCTVLVGIWFYFLFVVCIPYAKTESRFDDENAYEEVLEDLTLISAGAGISSCAAFFLVYLGIMGMRRTPQVTILSIVMVLVYVAGWIILMAGRGRLTSSGWDCEKRRYYYMGEDCATTRLHLIGLLIGDSVYLFSGLMLILPDFGFMRDTTPPRESNVQSKADSFRPVISDDL